MISFFLRQVSKGRVDKRDLRILNCILGKDVYLEKPVSSECFVGKTCAFDYEFLHCYARDLKWAGYEIVAAKEESAL